MTPARRTPAVAAAVVAGIALGAVGLLSSRADVAAMGLPLVMWAAIALGSDRARERAVLDVSAPVREGPDVVARVAIAEGGDGEAVHVVALQAGAVARDVLLAPGEGFETRSTVLHSGPWTPVEAMARPLAADGGIVGPVGDAVRADDVVPPAEIPLGALPEPRRLTGLNGGHEGRRPGQGGDFRDIHPFAPGDELRRVDWKATARLARRPGELHVRRANTLSEASVAIVVDAADDVGEVVATWPTGDPTRSGPTSLDATREAVRSIATAVVAQGDRVSLHELGAGGRTVRGGAGARHLARVVAAAAAVRVRESPERFERLPPLPRGSVVCLVSTLLDARVRTLATAWAAAGHRVLAIDALRDPDPVRLTAEERVGLRIVLAERADGLRALADAGVEVVPWGHAVPRTLRVLSRGAR